MKKVLLALAVGLAIGGVAGYLWGARSVYARFGAMQAQCADQAEGYVEGRNLEVIEVVYDVPGRACVAELVAANAQSATYVLVNVSSGKTIATFLAQDDSAVTEDERAYKGTRDRYFRSY